MTRRTTVTLDADVAAKLEEEARQGGRSMREVLNEALRRGLSPRRAPGVKPFRVTGPFARAREGTSFDHIEDLLDQLEGPARR